MDIYKTKLLRRLKKKCKDAQEELVEVTLLQKDLLGPFTQEVSNYCIKNKIKNPFNDGSVNKSKDKSIKKFSSAIDFIFRKIATSTHPDKLDDEDLTDIYVSATKAKKNQDVSALLSIAQDLKINLDHLSYQDIGLIEQSIHETNKKISQIKHSYVWLWSFSPSDKKDDLILSFIDSYRK